MTWRLCFLSTVLSLIILATTTPALSDARIELFEGKFRSFDTQPNPRVIRSADLNGDGYFDLVTSHDFASQIGVHFGNPDRTLDAPVPYEVTSFNLLFPEILLLVDVTEDQVLDVVVAGAMDAPNDSVFVLPGTGGGAFGAPISFGSGSGDIRGVGVGDFDEDTHLDMAVTGGLDGTVRIFLGDGSGAFSLFAQFVAGTDSRQVSVGDFNGDDHLDLAIADPLQGQIVVLQGSGNGVFFPLTILNVTDGPGDVAVVDLGNNGTQDIVVAAPPSNIVEVYFGYDDGTFDPPIQYSMGGPPQYMELADIDADTWPDVMTSNANEISVRYGTASGNFGVKSDFFSGTTAPLTSADVDGDGVVDLAITSYGINGINLLFGNGDRTFGVQDLDYDTEDKPFQVVADNLDADTDVDIVVANSGTVNVSVLRGNGDGSFGPRLNQTVGPNPTSVATGDFDGDLNSDIVAANSGKTFDFCGPTGELPACCDPLFGFCVPLSTVQSMLVSVLDGNGDATFQEKEDQLVGQNPQWVSTADLDGNSTLDVVAANSTDRSVSVLLGAGDGTFALNVDYMTGFDPVAVAIADLDADMDLDLVVANASSGSVSVLLGNGGGTFVPRVDYEATPAPRSVAVAEVTGDTVPDLVVGGFPVVILAGNGDGTFATAVELNIAGYTATGDLDLDGITDLAVANSGRNAVSTLYGAGDGTFPVVYHYGTGNVPLTVTVADVTGDGRPDLLVPNFVDDDVTVLVNRETVTGTGGGRALPGIALHRSRPNPARDASTIGFSLDRGADVALRIYDVRGRLVRTLTQRYWSPGIHLLEWDLRSDAGTRVPSGVYSYELRGPFGRDAKRLVVTR